MKHQARSFFAEAVLLSIHIYYIKGGSSASGLMLHVVRSVVSFQSPFGSFTWLSG